MHQHCAGERGLGRADAALQKSEHNSSTTKVLRVWGGRGGLLPHFSAAAVADSSDETFLGTHKSPLLDPECCID